MKKVQKIYEEIEYKDIRDLLNKSVGKYNNNLAFKIKDKSNKENKYIDITYKEFRKNIYELGTGLMNMGFNNKRIAIIGPNKYEWIISYLAILCGGNVVVPLDKGLPEDEIKSLLLRSCSDIVIFSKEYEETMLNIKRESIIKEFICMDRIDNQQFKYLKDIIVQGRESIENGNNIYQNLPIDSEKMSVILFTSGTTSISKAVMLSQKNIVSNITALNVSEKIYDTDVNLAFLPFHHAFGITGLLFFLSNGALNVFCDGLRHIQENMVEYKVSVFVCVPLLIEAMYKKIMLEIDKKGKTKKVKFALKLTNFLMRFKIDIRRIVFKDIINKLGGNIRFIVSGAAAIDKNVAKAFNDFGILTVQGYGLTETAPVLCAENEKSIKYGSIGLPMYNVELKVDNKNEDGVGEIIAKGPNIMIGYYENKEETDKVLKNGWFYTGDLGKIDKDGFVFITGRRKNVIVLKNGKNIYPEELELLINNLPYVTESMIFGAPKDGDLLVSAKIVYIKKYFDNKFPNISLKEIQDMVWNDIKNINKGLTKYKYIKNMILTDQPMKKTTTAKVKRYEELKNCDVFESIRIE